jgi:hypothetical protein
MRVRTNTDETVPPAGQLLRLTQAASPQFIEPILVRVRRIIEEWTTYEGWVWMDVYQIGLSGEAVDGRRLFVKLAGLEFVDQPEQRREQRRSRNQRNEVAARPPRVQPDRVYATAAGRRLI